MKHPEGYIDQSRPGKSLPFNKAIYDLKQSGKERKFMLDSTQVKLGFIACEIEPCHDKQTGNGNLLYMFMISWKPSVKRGSAQNQIEYLKVFQRRGQRLTKPFLGHGERA